MKRMFDNKYKPVTIRTREILFNHPTISIISEFNGNRQHRPIFPSICRLVIS
ncbi:hypothetical protein Hanom_Chr05g00470601 [Helianthus anomalus]